MCHIDFYVSHTKVVFDLVWWSNAKASSHRNCVKCVLECMIGVKQTHTKMIVEIHDLSVFGLRFGSL